jgi:hypothetical protein
MRRRSRGDGGVERGRRASIAEGAASAVARADAAIVAAIVVEIERRRMRALACWRCAVDGSAAGGEALRACAEERSGERGAAEVGKGGTQSLLRMWNRSFAEQMGSAWQMSPRLNIRARWARVRRSMDGAAREAVSVRSRRGCEARSGPAVFVGESGRSVRRGQKMRRRGVYGDASRRVRAGNAGGIGRSPQGAPG